MTTGDGMLCSLDPKYRELWVNLRNAAFKFERMERPRLRADAADVLFLVSIWPGGPSGDIKCLTSARIAGLFGGVEYTQITRQIQLLERLECVNRERDFNEVHRIAVRITEKGRLLTRIFNKVCQKDYKMSLTYDLGEAIVVSLLTKIDRNHEEED